MDALNSSERVTTPTIEDATLLPTRNQSDYRKFQKTALKLDVERIQLRWDDKKGQYVARDEDPPEDTSKSPVKTYAMSIVRRFMPSRDEGVHSVSEGVHFHSAPLIAALKEVMIKKRDIPWEAKPLKFEPEDLLAFMPRLRARVDELTKQEVKMDLDESAVDAVNYLEFIVEFLDKEYREQLQELNSLISANQITFDRLWGVFLPGTILFTQNRSGDSAAVRMISMVVTDSNSDEPEHYELLCEYVDIVGTECGFAEQTIKIPYFTGAKLLTELAAYPLEPNLVKEYTEVINALVERGKRYWDILREYPWCHVSYNAVAFREDFRKVVVKSRIILDREMYDSRGPAETASLKYDLDGEQMSSKSRKVPSDHDFMLMSPVAYGYSLSDRSWFLFRIDDVKDISWNPNIFSQLELHQEKKELIKSLVESHRSGTNPFDDFVMGKGAGLVFNLHGMFNYYSPPGVGKTLTAEATSEIIEGPLYIVGSSDLGGTAGELDEAISSAFELAFRWKAVILIDEADVFLEKRDIRDIGRNAMVAVFLRQLEYYPGIIFLTTNRVEVFDEAMKSRIHVSLFYDQLSLHAKEQLWANFLQKTNMHGRLSSQQIDYLRRLPLNGREIKNVVKVASTLVSHYKRAMTYEDILRAIKTLNQGPDVNPISIREMGSRPLQGIHLPSYPVVGLIFLTAAALTKYYLRYHLG